MEKIKGKLAALLALLIFMQFNLMAQSDDLIIVKPFNKVIVSPHIKLILEEGNQESVKLINNKISFDKIHVELKGKTLHIYLEDAKITAKTKTIFENGIKKKVSIYKGVQVVAHVTYKNLEELSIRGEEKSECRSPLNGEKFILKMYGEANLKIQEVNLSYLKATLYGENTLEIISGLIYKQVFRTYGESNILVDQIDSKITLIRAWGESEFNINASEIIKFSCVGENVLNYKGDAEFKKGMAIGENDIHKIK